MSDERLGQLFAFLTAICWVIGANFFEIAGRRIGSLVVNVLRLALATLLLGLICVFTRGSFWPTDMPSHTYTWIIISGAVGFFLCDMCLFRAFVLAGARRSMLMLCLAPCVAAVLDLLNGQPPTSRIVLGMVVTLSGVVWVIAQKPDENASSHSRSDLRLGALLGLAAAVLQAFGALCAEKGLKLPTGGRYDEIAATFIRALAGTVCFAILLLATGRSKLVVTGVKDGKAVAALSTGAVFGPVIGVTLFLASLTRIQPSVTQTILATMPILMLPIAHFVRKEKITASAVLGTLVAVTGVIILCWK